MTAQVIATDPIAIHSAWNSASSLFMGTPKQKSENEERIPFDDALKRILNAPPMPKVSGKKKPAKDKKKAA